MNDSEKYCLSLLRSGDYDRYISVLFAPKDRRAGLAALYAFHLELARIQDTVKEPLAGEIRLRWWRDAITSGSAEGQTPVLMVLLATIKRYDLPLKAFTRMCDARVFDLYHDAMPGHADLEGYYGDTSALVIQLACHILDREAAAACTDACSCGGVAQGLSGLLRLLPITTLRDQLYIPPDILAAAGTTREALRFSAPDDDAARARVASAIIALAYEHYGAFAAAVNMMPVNMRVAFLPLATVPAYLKAAEALGAKVFEEAISLSRLRRQWLMLRTALSGRFLL